MRNDHAMIFTLAALAAGWIGAAGFVAPASARSENGATALKAEVVTMPHSAPVSDGVPVVTGTRRGRPEVAYQGEGSGSLGAGVAVFGPARGGGKPTIDYVAPATMAVPGVSSSRSPDPAVVQAARPTAVPGEVGGLLRDAREALRANRTAAARDRLEQAETALLNAPTDGEQGFGGVVRDLAAARAALAAGRREAAQRNLAEAMQTLGRTS